MLPEEEDFVDVSSNDDTDLGDDTAAQPEPTPEPESSEPDPEPVSTEQPETDTSPDPTPEPVDAEKHTFLQSLQQYGFQNLSSVDEAQERALAEMYHQQNRNRQLEEELARRDQALAELNRAKPEPQPEPAKKPWAAPEYDADAVRRYQTQDENGNVVFRPDTPAAVRQQYEDYVLHQEKFARSLLENPEETIGSLVEDRVSRLVEERLSQSMAEQQQRQFVDQISTQYADQLWQRDPRTNQPMPGVPSEFGQRVIGYVEYAANSGVQDIQQQWDFAQRMAQNDYMSQYIQQLQEQLQQQSPPSTPASTPAATPAPAPTPEQVQEQRRRDFVNRRQPAPEPVSRGGSFQGEQRQNRHQGGGEEFAELALANGIVFE